MYAGIDLGSTNIKVAIYDSDFKLLDRRSRPVSYIRENGFVEFDAHAYFQELLALLREMVIANNISTIRELSLTGQAESLVVLGNAGQPLMNAISWMDERSTTECEELAQRFTPEMCEAVTGQMSVLPTWPATKILWLKHNRPEVYDRAARFMLLKDYIVYCLTGIELADMSIATFSFYFDIYNKCYWQDMLDAIGVSKAQLPPLREPCTVAGTLLAEVAKQSGLSTDTKVNIGTLDHFAGMIGTGNIRPGGITLSTGTVMALAAMCDNPVPRSCGIAMHYGFLPDTYVMLPVAESGGASLEWFRKTCMPDVGYDKMNAVLSQRSPNELIFLPYLVGTNAPEFDSKANGVFWGLRQEHDVYDMAAAVMEGVACVLRKNCDYIAKNGVVPTAIIATGGGAKSAIWCQMQADITGLPVLIPAEKEAACLGASMIAAVSSKRFDNYADAVKACVSTDRCYMPHPTNATQRKYHRFCALYDAALTIRQYE